MVWSRGMLPVKLPPQAGLPFGTGEDTLFLLNIHYGEGSCPAAAWQLLGWLLLWCKGRGVVERGPVAALAPLPCPHSGCCQCNVC